MMIDEFQSLRNDDDNFDEESRLFFRFALYISKFGKSVSSSLNLIGFINICYYTHLILMYCFIIVYFLVTQSPTNIQYIKDLIL